MEIKVAFFDVDGTIVDNHSTHSHGSDMELVPASTIEAIRLLKENGITPFIATGRSPFMIEDLLEGLEIDSYICTNGQYAVMHGKVIHEAPYSETLLDEIVDVSKKHDIPLLWMPAEHYILSGANQELLLSGLEAMKLPYPRIQTDLEKPDFKVYQMVAGVTKENEHFFESIKEIRIVRWQENGVDLLPLHGSKATAIQTILDKIGLKPENALAFGDGFNDIEMLQAVGMGVAMGNAHKDVQKHANYVTKPVHEDGIYHACKHFGLT